MKQHIKTNISKTHICSEAPAILPDLPGWILDHPSEVEKNQKIVGNDENARAPAHQTTEVIVYPQGGAEFNTQQRIGCLRR